jgi:methyl-accepting chemotaxis protein
MKKMTLGWRLGTSFGGLILLIGVLGGIAAWGIYLASASATDVSIKHAPEVRVAQMMSEAAWQTRFNILGYSLSGNEEQLRTGRSMLVTLNEHLKAAGELAAKYPDLAALQKGKREADEKTADYKTVVDKLETEFKNNVVVDATLSAAGKLIMQQGEALWRSEEKRMNEELEQWEAQTKKQEPNEKAAPAEGMEPTAKVDMAALKQRLMKLGMIADIINTGNTIQINNYKALNARDTEALGAVLKDFVTLEKNMGTLAPLLDRQENITQISLLQKATQDYKTSMEKDLQSKFAIRENMINLFRAGQAVTGKASEVANGGIQSIGAASTEVSRGLDLTGTILQIGILTALITGVLIAWLSTRAITAPIREGINALAATASQISTTISQLASNASETAAAVAETTITVDEVRQTAQVAADKAKAVADSAQGSVHAAETGRKATDQTIHGLNLIRDQMSSICESITRLNLQSQAVGDIVATVADLAEQSNLLAVNASIEAAKAGDHGKGFGVVAQEIRNLAGQSKDSTKQVRTILTDVQKATGNAVIAAEQGSRGVADGSQQADEAGQAIRVLTSTIQETTRAAVQIAASSQQQLIGMEQVGRAMENIKTATSQNAEGAKQLATAAHNLRDIGARLKALVDVDDNEGLAMKRAAQVRTDN